MQNIPRNWGKGGKTWFFSLVSSKWVLIPRYKAGDLCIPLIESDNAAPNHADIWKSITPARVIQALDGGF